MQKLLYLNTISLYFIYKLWPNTVQYYLITI